MIKKAIILLYVLCAGFCCKEPNDDDCSTVLCVANLQTVSFIIVNADTKENVFSSEKYSIEDVTVTGGHNSITVELFDNSETIFLQLSENFDVGTYTYAISIGEANEFDLNFVTERSPPGGCCGNTLTIKTMEVQGIVHNFDYSYQIPTILVE
ncbi:hypothetical protein GGR42_003379 [Saonia flava]|uniref:Uncharacterized protein n=1 Tax=Saonia flava TaxID=523696 RepID=A0A846QX03_9FLAO|nr:hypothetical protein [Saonia flava]NJB72881.1 hypothetical protein [Saonia flava]